MNAWKLCAMLLLSLAGGSAWAQAPEPAAPSALRVTYLVYSGRPNPTLTITDAKTIRSLRSQLSSALATGAGMRSTELQPKLGYNGILVESVGEAAPQYTLKGRFLRADGRATSADAKAPTIAASASTAATLIEAQLLKLGEQQGVLSPSTAAMARKGAGK